MRRAPVRRAQLVSPFGVGALLTTPDGTSMITAGLDHWYEREGSSLAIINTGEFEFEEWRLQILLSVDHFRLPPDFRERRAYQDTPNAEITVPFLRFPQWHVCPDCHLLEEQPAVAPGRIQCNECKSNTKSRFMFQVRFIAICEAGHIQDFPWKEWVHRTPNPTCDGTLRLISTGSASLAGQLVTCSCGKTRTLAHITDLKEGSGENGGTTVLTSELGGEGYPCPGRMPWLGGKSSEPCGKPLRGALRNASNVYYAQVASSLYLPRSNSERLEEVIEALNEREVQSTLELLRKFFAPRNQWAPALKDKNQMELGQFSETEIEAGLKAIESAKENLAKPKPRGDIIEEDANVTFRRPEFALLRESQAYDDLKVAPGKSADYDTSIASWLERINLVTKLKETRALAGFSRIYPDDGMNTEQRKARLRRHIPPPNGQWLPAYIVRGEGIYLELKEGRLQAWERRGDVQERIKPLATRFAAVQTKRRLKAHAITPRFLLVHTLAHLIMNRLVFECGYSSAALRERMYVSDNARQPMAGMLIYTAAGDADGTLGGLVRMGKPGYLEPVIRRALENAEWCSADPVCMEIGQRGGQGPDSCNLAACHSCALVPETSCEEFNRFLDRGVLIGEETGYFRDSLLGRSA